MELLSSQDLVTQVRSHADIEDSDFITDTEISRYLNLAYRTLYDIIVDANQDLFVDNLVFRGANYPMQLPLDFYKLRGLDVRYSDYFVQAKRVGFMSRQHAQIEFIRPYSIHGIIDDITYSLRGNELKLFSSVATEDSTLVLWYLPKPKKIEDGAMLPAGWERYLIYSACRDCRVKEDSSTKDFERQMMLTRQDVEDFCMRRDWANNPMIQKTGDLEVDERSYGWALGDILSGGQSDTRRTLAPSVGRKSILPEGLSQYKVIDTHTAYINDDMAYCGMEMPQGLIGKYGQWVLVYMFREVGNIYITQQANPNYTDLSSVFAAMPLVMNIDPAVYQDARAFFNVGKLCYDSPTIYTADTQPSLPPSTVGCEDQSYEVSLLWSDSNTVLPEPAYGQADTATRFVQALPMVAQDSYLVVQFRSREKQVRGLLFDSALNQLDGFTRTATMDGQGRHVYTYVSINRLDAQRFSERQITIEVV